jgi:hypothetical protein
MNPTVYLETTIIGYLAMQPTTSSKKQSGKMLLATEKSSGSHHDAQSPRP